MVVWKPIVHFVSGLLNVLLVLLSILLICLVLIQRVKGGNRCSRVMLLSGDYPVRCCWQEPACSVLTRVTLVTAVVWFLLNIGLAIV